MLRRRPFLVPTIVLMAIALPIATRTGRAQSQQLSAAGLHASVEIDPHGVFLYKYSVENGPGSTTGISKITIDLSVPAGASAPSASGLAHGPGYFAEPSTVGRNPKAGAVIPVG